MGVYPTDSTNSDGAWDNNKYLGGKTAIIANPGPTPLDRGAFRSDETTGGGLRFAAHIEHDQRQGCFTEAAGARHR